MALTRNLALTFEHIQSVAADTWTIVHNLKMYPIVDVYIDYNGGTRKILPEEVTYVNENTCVVTFSSPQSGKAMVC